MVRDTIVHNERLNAIALAESALQESSDYLSDDAAAYCREALRSLAWLRDSIEKDAEAK